MLSKSQETKISKYMSYVLRHRPDSIGLKLDNAGWVGIDEFIEKTKEFQLTKEIISEVVKNCEKQRYKISEDGTKIRASQGHSIDVDLKLANAVPPVVLYHGTATRFLEEINKKGLLSMSRHAVHLSEKLETAKEVGKRHGTVVVLKVDAKEMLKDGFKFQKSDNGVWLTESVPSKYFSVLS